MIIWGFKVPLLLYDVHYMAKVCSILAALFIIAWLNFDQSVEARPHLRGGKIFLGTLSSSL
ncbi:CIC11C00000005508 [Sungouiella intermedia]|uniref:CIC11C00000005508 n=1 Tax=Sungouiella intermedia TaxID=45354 RepID=A0A1L0C3L7_9ASCO|nr:CIC11C00000005508 [[Candida] intermedia]